MLFLAWSSRKRPCYKMPRFVKEIISKMFYDEDHALVRQGDDVNNVITHNSI
jgi:hypothetical protein